MSGPIRALTCPLCGGAVAPPSGSRVVACTYCDRRLLYTGPDFLPRFVLPPVLSDADHKQACARLFKHPLAARGLGQRAMLLRHRRIYVPFYLLTGKRGGVLAIGKERIVSSPGFFDPVNRIAMYSGEAEVLAPSRPTKTEVRVDEDSRVILGDFRYIYAAALLESWGFSDSDLKDTMTGHMARAQAATVSELAKEGDVVDPDIPLERVVEKGVSATRSAKGELAVLEMQTAIVYVPVMSLTFRAGNHVFTVLRDELDGNWLAGELPFRTDWGALLALPIVAGLGLIGGKMLGFFARLPTHSFTPNADMVHALFVMGLVAACVFGLGIEVAWLVLRTPCIVRIGPAGARVEAAGPAPKNPFGPLNLLAAAFLKAMTTSQKRSWSEL